MQGFEKKICIDDLEISGAMLEDLSYFEKIETFLLSDCMGWMVQRQHCAI